MAVFGRNPLYPLYPVFLSVFVSFCRRPAAFVSVPGVSTPSSSHRVGRGWLHRRYMRLITHAIK